MMHILAELPPPSPQDLFAFLGCVAAILSIIVLFKKAFGREPQVPQPLVVEGNVRHATHEELEQLRREFERFQESWRHDLDELEHRIDENYKQSIKAGEARATKIHDRINAIGENMPHRVIDLLKMTGVIKS